jgi:hypothetical protein
LQRSRELLAKVWGDPNLRGGVRKYVKELFPDRHLPDDDFDAIAAPLKAENVALQKKLDDFLESQKKRDEDLAKREEEANNARYAGELDAAVKRFGLTDEGRQKMIARMQETRNFTAPMDAAAYIVSQEPPVMPSGPLYGSATLDFAGGGEAAKLDEYKVLHSGLDGPSKYLEQEIRKCFGPNGKEYVAKEMGRTYADLAFAQ